MQSKTRKQEIAEFFQKCDLYMPPSIPGREAIHYFIHRGNGSGGTTPAERVIFFRQFAARWNGRLVKHMTETGSFLYRIRYVLPKLEHEVGKARMGRMKGREFDEMCLFKACIRDTKTGTSRVVPLDMFVEVWPL